MNNNWDKIDEAISNSGGARNIGEIVSSTIPLTDAGLHLLDGALINGSGIYSAFVDYIAGLDLTANYFCTEAEWQASVTNYGVCGKFVYDSTNNTVRLPKITGIVEGTTDLTSLCDLVEAGLPNITGSLTNPNIRLANSVASGCFSREDSGTTTASAPSNNNGFVLNFDASNSNSIYGNSSTVQPQTIKVLYYIVVATTTKTDIQVDIDEIATDLNSKADRDGSNMVSSVKNFDGQWVGITSVGLYSGNSRTSDLAIDISSYIPNDNYNYEILVWASISTSSTSGSIAHCGVKSDIITDEVIICQCRTRASSNVNSGGNAIIPIHNRTITLVGFSSNTGSTYLSLGGYRRIGTNS